MNRISGLSVTLGYFLDGHAYPGPLCATDTAIGTIALGPMGFLSMLQTWLGLPALPLPGGQRIAQCLRAARFCCGTGHDPFYAASFTTAPWPTAQRLLAMRNELAMAGWSGKHPTQGSRRLQDLAELDRLLPAAEDLPAKLNATIAAIQQWSLPQAMTVTCLEPVALWPQCWRRLFSVLQECGVTFQSWTLPEENEQTSILARVQAFLRHVGEKSQPVNDRSLRLVRAGSVEEAAETLAELLPLLSEQGSTVLVRTDPSLPLEVALARFHQPTTGVCPSSRWRSILQLLPICLRMRWKPRSMQALLDFLLLPQAPVPARVRHLMATALQDFPGIGNERWQSMAVHAQEYLRDTYADKAEDKWQDTLRWLEPDVYDENSGMPLSAIESVCMDIATWAVQRAKTAEDAGLLKVLAAQATDFVQLAKEAGESRFTRPTLEAMLDHECALGADHTFSEEEAALWHVVDHPGQIHGPLDTLLWWQFRDPGLARHHVWTEDELQWLKAEHFSPVLADEEHQLEYHAWVRALCCTRRQCILVVPERDAGQDVVLHPFWDHIATVFTGNTAQQALSCPARMLLEEANVPVSSVDLQPCPEELEEPLRLAPQPIPENLSFSVAEKILQCPFHGLLASRLHPSGPQAAGLPILQRLFGNFSHYLLQQMLSDRALPDPAKAGDYIEALAVKYLPTHAALLQEQRYTLSWQSFIRSIRNVAEGMVIRIQEAALSSPGAEVPLKRKLPTRDTVIYGRADIVFKSKATPVIWDLKWSYDRKKFAGMLDEGTAYQLAAYSWMEGTVKDVAYWLLPDNTFMGTENSGAVGSEIHDVDMGDMWNSMAAELENIFSEWEHGIAGIAARDEKGKVKKTSGCTYCELSFVCGRAYA